MNKRPILASALFILMAGTLVYAAANLIIPLVNVPAPLAQTSSACNGNLVQTGPVNPINGTLRFNCPTSGAFTVTAVGINTPTFTLSPGYTGLGFVSHGAADCSLAITLVSGTQVNLANIGDFDLCAPYNVGPVAATLASFTFAWAS